MQGAMIVFQQTTVNNNIIPVLMCFYTQPPQAPWFIILATVKSFFVGEIMFFTSHNLLSVAHRSEQFMTQLVSWISSPEFRLWWLSQNHLTPSNATNCCPFKEALIAHLQRYYQQSIQLSATLRCASAAENSLTQGYVSFLKQSTCGNWARWEYQVPALWSNLRWLHQPIFMAELPTNLSKNVWPFLAIRLVIS